MKKLNSLYNYLKNNSFYKEASDLSDLNNNDAIADDEELLSLLLNDDTQFLNFAQKEEIES